jgi:F-type H+-transporting ATPase subunit a
LFNIIPFFRPLPTDFNTPLALAIIVFVVTGYWGIQEHGFVGYLKKFFPFEVVASAIKDPMKIFDLIVGALEFLLEFVRIISLSVRLFANILAGGILLLIISFLLPFAVPLVFFVLEIAFGLIQAYIFATLTIIYASIAMAAHK